MKFEDLHAMSLVAGRGSTVRCSCGWRSRTFREQSKALAAFDAHVAKGEAA